MYQKAPELSTSEGLSEAMTETALIEDFRDRLLAAALPEAAFDGWRAGTLVKAEKAAGLPEGGAGLACPSGVVDLLDHWHLRADEAMERALAAQDLAAMKIREKVAAGVLARIDAVSPENREAARRAAHRLALPDAAPRAARMVWRTCDRIWRAIGDRSTDGNHYSKRAILAGVFASTFAVWLDAEEEADVEAFLDRRIDNVMQFEKFKAQARKVHAKLPDPTALAAALRYPRRGL